MGFDPQLVRPGMRVYDRDHVYVGRVVSVDPVAGIRALPDGPAAGHLLIPPEGVALVHGQHIVLTVRERDLDALGWRIPASLGTPSA